MACSTLLAANNITQASAFSIDTLTVVKNGKTILIDDFNNGDARTGGPFSNGNTATYSSFNGVLPTETDGHLQLDPFSGSLITSSLTGQQIFIQQARLNTNIDNTNLKKGLKDDDTFSVTGLFDLTAPVEFKERFGIRLTDRGAFNPGANGALGDVVEVDVRRLKRGVFVEFREQDRPNSTNIRLGKIKLNLASLSSLGMTADPFSLYDQIALKLERTSTTGNIFGSFTLLDTSGSNANFNYNFGGMGASIFEGERFTRAEIMSVALSVPETNTLILFGIGLLGLFSSAKRKNT